MATEEHTKPFEEFLNKWWSLPLPNEPASLDQIRVLKRQVWYCNISGQPIPDLQEFNENPVRLNYKGSSDFAKLWYDRGYQSFRVYKSGIAFLDIELAIALYDWSLVAPEQIAEIVENLQRDPAEENRGKSRMDMYSINNQFALGTVILRNTLPKKMLKYLVKEFPAGQVVDVSGYRGTGLYINLGDTFARVDTENCYPCWELDWLLKWGYYYYLAETPVRETFFQLPLNGDILLSGNNAEFQDEYGCDPDDFELGDYLGQNKERIKLKRNGEWVDLNPEEIPFPFTSANEGNAFIKASKEWGVQFSAKISERDWLLFKEGELWVKPINGGKPAVKIAWEW